MDFPLYTSKNPNITEHFDLSDSIERRKYFYAKAKPQIEKIQEHLERNTFLGFLLAKKAAGKGTYSRMLAEIIGEEKLAIISVGDLIRSIYSELSVGSKSKECINEVKPFYRGYLNLEEAVGALLNKNQSTLIPTEFILALLKREIQKHQGKAIFIDGFPRSLDQVSYSLYFREIMNLRPDPDFFVLIDVPEIVIDERMKYRVICPLCQTSRNTKLLPTKFVEQSPDKKSFLLKCDNEACSGFSKQVMVAKEGDNMGIEPIRARLKTDGELIEKIATLQGVPKIRLRNAIPASKTKDTADGYEVTPEYSYTVQKDGSIIVTEKPWEFKDDKGVSSNSLLAAPLVLSFIDQLSKIL